MYYVIALPQSRLQMQDLGGLPLLFMSVEYCPRKIVEAEYAKAQIKTQVVLEMTSHERILQAVAEGAGLTILPELYVRLRLARIGVADYRLVRSCSAPFGGVGLPE
jgi:DNA-binding transcriptional LysR family regulator